MMTTTEIEAVLKEVSKNSKEKRAARSMADFLLEITEDISEKEKRCEENAKELDKGGEPNNAAALRVASEQRVAGMLDVLTRVTAYLYPVYMRKDAENE